MDDFEGDIVVVAFTDVVALLVVVENWFCPFGVEKTTLKTLLEAAEKAVFFIVVVVFKASLLKEEEEDEDKEVDEIAWFMFASCVCLFSVFWRKKKFFVVSVEKKKAREIFTYAKTLFLSSKKVSKGQRAFFFLATSSAKTNLFSEEARRVVGATMRTTSDNNNDDDDYAKKKKKKKKKKKRRDERSRCFMLFVGVVFSSSLFFFFFDESNERVRSAFFFPGEDDDDATKMISFVSFPVVLVEAADAAQEAGKRSTSGSAATINEGTNSIVNFHRHHREVRKRLRERKMMTKGQREDHRNVDSSLSLSENVEKEGETSNDANVVLVTAGVNKDKDKDKGKNKEAEENKKLTSLFKEISARRRQEILAAMTDFAKTEAEKNGETFADVRPELGKTPAALEEEKKMKEYAKDPSLERKVMIEKIKEEDPMNPNVHAPIRTDEDSIVRIDYGTYDSCDTCELCHLGDAPVDGVEVNKHQEIRGNPGVSKEDMEDESNTKKPVHCKECYGCNVRLSRIIKRAEFKGKSVQVFSGASGAAILKGKILKKDFLLSDDNDFKKNNDEDDDKKDKISAGVNHHEELEEADAEMTVFVKAWCNFGKYAQTPDNPKSGVPSKCSDYDKINLSKYGGKCHVQGGRYGFGDCNFKFISSLDKLAHAANLSSVVPRSWTVEVKSFLPWDGFSTGGHKLQKGVRAQFYEKAPGVSIEAVLGTLDPTVNFGAFKNISHDNVIRAATFDLLFSESDRHGQNVFFSDEGEITLIDSEGAFGESNTMLLPGHQKYEINRIGFSAIVGCGQNCPGEPKPSVSPMATLDYRCHVPRQYVGFEFPSGVEPFLKRIQSMSAKSVVEEFKMTREEHANHLKRTVDEMLSLGFEGAMLSALSRQRGGNGYPIGKYGLQYWYPITKACCGLETCPIHTTRMKEKNIRDDLVTLKKDDPGVEATTLWGDRYEAHATTSPELGLERLKTKVLSSSSKSSA